MRWALLLVMLAALCAIVNVVRGVMVYDGVSLLAVAFLAAAVVAAFLVNSVERRSKR